MMTPPSLPRPPRLGLLAGPAAAPVYAATDWLPRRRLQRMQRLATGLLLAMLTLLVASVALRPHFSWLDWVIAFAEAAVVGAVADWFAVVALFRHPLGLPFPHTAIVPNNKDRIGESIGEFVQDQFLTPANITERLSRENVAGRIGEWLIVPANARNVAGQIADCLPYALAAVEDTDLRRLIDRTVLRQLDKLDLSAVVGHVLTLVIADRRHQQVLDRVLDLVATWLGENRDRLKEKFSEQSKLTPSFFDRFVVDKFVDGILALMRDIQRDPDHDVRHELDRMAEAWRDRMLGAEEMRERLAALKASVGQWLRQDRLVGQLVDDFKRTLLEDLAQPESVITRQIEEVLLTLGDDLVRDEGVQRKTNAYLLGIVETLAMANRAQISSLIADVVRRWDAAEIADKIQVYVGRDLQYIRINGTVVGGSVGLLLHLVLHKLAF